MRKSESDVKFYINLVNEIFGQCLWLSKSNGTNTIKAGVGNEPVFTGTMNECYYFLLGMSKIKLNK